MPLRLRPRLGRPAARLHTTAHRRLATRIPVPTTTPTTPTLQQRLSSPLPITATCPPPTCPCVPSPAATLSLDIDRTTPLAGALPRYHRHLLISTSRADWASKIELDGDGGLAQRVKSVAATYGLRDPFAPTLVTNSSFSPASEDADSAYIFPGNVYIPRIPRTTEAVTALLKGYLLPGGGEAAAAAAGLLQARRVPETIVLVCSHTSRDARCGLVAPALVAQFDAVLKARGLQGSVKVACTSHLSGHKFAGNIVVYLPPREGEKGDGLGVWYGRVEPEHVEGIVDETVLGGRVVGGLCRGVVGGEVVDERS